MEIIAVIVLEKLIIIIITILIIMEITIIEGDIMEVLIFLVVK